MLRIIIPNNNVLERKYVIDVVFHIFLGIDYELYIDGNVRNYFIYYNNCSIEFRDSFFSKYEEDMSYLNQRNLPAIILYTNNEFVVEKDIPIIFGTDELSYMEHKITCGIDIFASVFFMLTRWEVYVNPMKDLHGRFQAINSIAFKFNFLNRPIVNEYIEMLWNMLLYIGLPIRMREQRSYQLIMTHDIDYLSYPRLKVTKSILGDLIKRRKYSLAINKIKTVLDKDPFNCFTWLMDNSERKGCISHFYFMATPCLNSIYDTQSYLRYQNFGVILSDIMHRGHMVGFHPSYNSYNDEKRWRDEKIFLESKIQGLVNEGRQHYLRVLLPDTLCIWNSNSMYIDSSLGYADCEGFRCGTGDEFPIFDFIHRIKFSLKERPLILMDGTLNGYRNYTLSEIYDCINYYINISQKYNSKLTFLFHNSSFSGPEWNGWKALYESI